MKTVSVKLSPRLVRWLATEAKRSGRTRSAVVHEALERLRGRTRSRPGIRKKFKNLAEALSSLGGTFEGPRDLSTNPKYFDDFGN